jgi:hypothetical protein
LAAQPAPTDATNNSASAAPISFFFISLPPLLV